MTLGGTPGWSELTTSGGPTQSIDLGLSMLIHDTGRDRLVRAGFNLDELWELPLGAGPLTWTQLPAPAGAWPPGSTRGFALDPLGDRLLTFGLRDDDTWELAFGSGTTAVEDTPLPGRIGRLTAAPNPFRSQVRFEFRLETPGQVELAIFDVRGRRVAVLVEGELEAGDHAVSWTTGRGGDATARGIYFATLRAAGETETRKLILLP